MTAPRRELLDHLSKTAAAARDLRTLLDRIGPLLVRIVRADRGFIRLFADRQHGRARNLGIVGFNARETMHIASCARMPPLKAGRCLRDGNTLLVPIIRRKRTIGFLCVDRHPPARPFTDEQAHLLIGLGQASMTLTAARSQTAARDRGWLAG